MAVPLKKRDGGSKMWQGLGRWRLSIWSEACPWHHKEMWRDEKGQFHLEKRAHCPQPQGCRHHFWNHPQVQKCKNLPWEELYPEALRKSHPQNSILDNPQRTERT